jgi:XTP/dITP diphosphohydrolase
MRQLIFATGNEGKLKEIRRILEDLDVEVLSLKEAGIQVEIEENGSTFTENAIIKAREIMMLTGMLTLADDSGLEVDCLNKEPGIYSARYLGENTSYDIKNKAILDRMKETQGRERSARFVCAIAALFPDGTCLNTLETMEGQIADTIAGTGGFGYDPIFYLPEYECTAAELSMDKKNEISHRGKALREMKEKLKNYIK